MTKSLQAAATEILSLIEPALSASTPSDFRDGLRLGFEGLYSRLAGGPDPAETLEALAAVFSRMDVPVRHRQMLELCAWPVFDKPALPFHGDEAPEYLWLYCVPFVVQLTADGHDGVVHFTGEAFDQAALTRAVAQSGRMNPQAVLSGTPLLLTREDLQKLGSANLSTALVQAELGLGSIELNSRGATLDVAIECARMVTIFAIGTARLPVGQRRLFNSTFDWPASALERLILAGLTEQGLKVARVASLPPCSMAESLLRCNSAGSLELQGILRLAQHHYKLEGVTLEHSAEGWAELHGTLTGEPDAILIAPPFSFVEPKGELQACVQHCCESLGIPFNGAFSVAIPNSSMLQ